MFSGGKRIPIENHACDLESDFIHLFSLLMVQEKVGFWASAEFFEIDDYLRVALWRF